MDYTKQLEDALVFIDQNLENRITVENVANSAGYSYYHFHRVFEAMLGETVGNYIRTRRLYKAARQLIYTNTRILDIAVNLQFESQESFSRAFKNLYATTPNRYRKNRIDTIIGQKKSLQFSDLRHRFTNLTLQPEIVTIEPVNLIGIRFSTSIQNNSIPDMWGTFNDRVSEIKNETADANRYGICEVYDDFAYDLLNVNTPVTYFIGLEVKDSDRVPHGMVVKTLEAGRYARFTHTGSVATILKTYQYIWGTWIPCSKYELDLRDDFECYTEKFLGTDNKKSQIDIYIPIK